MLVWFCLEEKIYCYLGGLSWSWSYGSWIYNYLYNHVNQ